MAAPTTISAAEVLVDSATVTTLDASNPANRQLVTVTNNGPHPITVVESSTGAPGSITPGKGIVVWPQSTEWFWNGQGARLYALVGPVPPGETAADQVTGAATWVVEKV
jgi:hypothetical protein